MIRQCCDNQKLIKNGTRNGFQNYQCKNCNAQMVDSDNPKHRPCLGDKPLTPAERVKRHRQKNKNSD